MRVIGMQEGRLAGSGARRRNGEGRTEADRSEALSGLARTTVAPADAAMRLTRTVVSEILAAHDGYSGEEAERVYGAEALIGRLAEAGLVIAVGQASKSV